MQQTDEQSCEEVKTKLLEAMNVTLIGISNVLNSDNTEDETRETLKVIYNTLYLATYDTTPESYKYLG